MSRGDHAPSGRPSRPCTCRKCAYECIVIVIVIVIVIHSNSNSNSNHHSNSNSNSNRNRNSNSTSNSTSNRFANPHYYMPYRYRGHTARPHP